MTTRTASSPVRRAGRHRRHREERTGSLRGDETGGARSTTGRNVAQGASSPSSDRKARSVFDAAPTFVTKAGPAPAPSRFSTGASLRFWLSRAVGIGNRIRLRERRSDMKRSHVVMLLGVLFIALGQMASAQTITALIRAGLDEPQTPDSDPSGSVRM